MEDGRVVVVAVEVVIVSVAAGSENDEGGGEVGEQLGVGEIYGDEDGEVVEREQGDERKGEEGELTVVTDFGQCPKLVSKTFLFVRI